MPKQAVASPQAPAAIGPYSPAVRSGALLFVSGQIALDPATGTLVDGGIDAETRRVLDNLGALLAASGATFADVTRTTVYLIDLNDFQAMNEVYGTYFQAPHPARSTVQVSRLPRDSRIEIDAIAALHDAPPTR